MTIAVGWDVKHQTKQTKERLNLYLSVLSADNLCSLDPDQARPFYSTA